VAALSDRGDALVAWMTSWEPGAPRYALYATRARPGEALPAGAAVSGAPASAGRSLGAAFDDSGQGLLLDVATRGAEGDRPVSAFALTAGGEVQPPVVLDTAGGIDAQPAVAFDAAGVATALWVGRGGMVTTADRSVDGTWTAPVALSLPGHSVVDPQLAMNAGGDAIAAWTWYRGQQPRQVEAAVRDR
jgi:hypothetical protein